jgi:hypothetical protein
MGLTLRDTLRRTMHTRGSSSSASLRAGRQGVPTLPYPLRRKSPGRLPLDVRICQPNVLIDQADGPGAAMMRNSVPVHARSAEPEPDGAHHEGRLGCRPPRPTAMTSKRDGDAARRLGSASNCFSEDLRRVLALVASTRAVSTLCTSAATAAADGWTVVDMKREWKTIFPVEP